MWQTNNTGLGARSPERRRLRRRAVHRGAAARVCAPAPGEVTRNRIAAFNANTGELITTFNPNANGMVYDLDVSPNGQFLYVAGSFTTIGGQTRQRIARLNLPSGTVDTAWSANANAIVATVISDNNNVYIGGDFTNVKNTARQRIAKLNTTNGNVVTAFTATPSDAVSESAIAPNGSRLHRRRRERHDQRCPARRDRLAQPDDRRSMPWAATGIVRVPTNGGCEAHDRSTSRSRAHFAYVTAGGTEPGLLGGLLHGEHRRRLAHLQPALPRRVGRPRPRARLDVPRLAQPRLLEEPRRLRRAEQLRQLHLVPPPGPPRSPTAASATGARRRTAGAPGPPPPSARRSSRPTARSVFIGGDFSTVNQQAQQGITRFTPQRRQLDARGADCARGSPRPPPARSRSASTASGTTTTATSP